jgi:hypothetical protein
MITIDIAGGSLILVNEAGTTIRVPLCEAPRLVAAALEALGVSGSRYQQGWRAGYAVGRQDGQQLGYEQRDREWTIAQERERTRAARAEVLALLGDAELAQAA